MRLRDSMMPISHLLQSLIRALAYSDALADYAEWCQRRSCNPSFGLWSILTCTSSGVSVVTTRLQSLIRALAYSDPPPLIMVDERPACCNPSFGLWPILTREILSRVYCSYALQKP